MRAIASDYDGTLFFNDIPSKIKTEDIKMIESFQKKGHLFGLCTGRPLIGISDIREKITLDFYILSSGAIVLNKDLQVIAKKCLDKQITENIFNEMKEKCQITIQANHKIYAYLTPANMPIPQEIFYNLDELSQFDIFGISLDAKTTSNAQKIHQEIIRQYGNIIDAYQNIQYIDIVKKGCSKGQAMNIIRNYFDIDQFYAIGDSYNDLPMFEQANHCFTFKNSPDVIKNQCDNIVLSVADALKKII